LKLGSSVAVLAFCLFFLAVAHAQTVSLSYAVSYSGTPYPTGSIVVAATFTNSGQVPLRVTDFSLVTDFGTFSASTGLPLVINAGALKELDMMVSIPSSVSVGGHQLTASAVFQYQDPSTMQWVTPSTSPQTVQSTLLVQQNPAILAWIGYGVLGLTALLAGLVVYYFSRLRRKPKPPVPDHQVPGPVA
jgi:hypothetical protein